MGGGAREKDVLGGGGGGGVEKRGVALVGRGREEGEGRKEREMGF